MKVINRFRPSLFLLGLSLILVASFNAARLSALASQPANPTPAVLTQVKQVCALTNEQAAKSIPANIEATVTYVQPEAATMFVQDEGYGTFVNFDKNKGLLKGDRVVVKGYTDPSFRPELTANDVQLLSHGQPPEPLPATFIDLIQARFDSLNVVVRGTVLSASRDRTKPEPGMLLRVQMPEGIIQDHIAYPGKLNTEELLGAEVQLTGVAGGAFDGRMQMAGVWLDTNSAADLVVEHSPATDFWNLPVVPMDRVIDFYRRGTQGSRIMVEGTLTYFQPGISAVLERNGLGLLVETDSFQPLHPGDTIQATGFAEVADGSVRLVDGQLRQKSKSSPLQPALIDWDTAASGKRAFNLVAIDGEVIGAVRDARVDHFIIRSDGHLFSATLRHRSTDLEDGKAQPHPVSVGSRVRVSGVCFMDAGNQWTDRLWFDLHMRSLDDIVILQDAGWWTVKRLAYVTTLLSVFILVAVIWVGLLDKRLRAQTAILARKSQEEAIRERWGARQEQRRSHILELISSAQPLPDVLREIAAMVSSRLYGVSCWFELNSNAGGTEGLERPTDPAIVFQELFSPEGTSMGYLLARPVMKASAQTDITAALHAGARLAELAIDTRRLYTDLRHRSEHDLLTNIPNRFSMERRLQDLMEEANRNGTSFGMIYVDLDRFKQVNDRFGHRTGDLYLQEVTRRMKLQLRGDDVLARIGGDEFIALVPILHSHRDAEDIASRLERSFDQPFEIEGNQLTGSASLGLAVYPDDGLTQEELQRAADNAMYANKEAKHRQELASHVVKRVTREDLHR